MYLLSGRIVIVVTMPYSFMPSSFQFDIILVLEIASFIGMYTKFLISLLFKLPPQYSTNPEKAMAPHSSTLAWKIPWTEEPGGLQSMGSLRVRQD